MIKLHQIDGLAQSFVMVPKEHKRKSQPDSSSK